MKTERSKTSYELSFWETSKIIIGIIVSDSTLTKQDEEIFSCYLTFQVSPEIYHHIDNKALFNLKPEIWSPFSNGAFQAVTDITIKATLDPVLLPEIAANSTTPEQVATYLQHLSQEQPNHPLLCVHSWYATEVSQKTTGYRTLWYYLNPADITANGIEPEKMNEAMLNFAQEWANNNGSGVTADAVKEAVEEMSQNFAEITDSISEMTQEMVSETVEEMTNAFAELAESISEISEEVASERTIFQVMVSFFQKEEWAFKQLDNSTLHLLFQGKNGQFNCYARAREAQKQFVFYSLCPVKVPPKKRKQLGEFVCRANFGMIIGNFELDFNTGEIRYKTSIDIKDSFLTEETLKQLVYTNVLTMDQYLPGIEAVISSKTSPEDAIAQIES
ncbi:MAG: YbjN domain-containing protein [Coleofasciculus sp. G1-WW12-02]|uniref:YbjN domain-containing protein n=1 Tax=Coleofasciculus sp. G1-WW12-02 TaxID=3068483 RepID=UPI003303108A